MQQAERFLPGETVTTINVNNNFLEVSKDVIECVCMYEDRTVYHLKGNPEKEVTDEGLFTREEALSRFGHFIDNE